MKQNQSSLTDAFIQYRRAVRNARTLSALALVGLTSFKQGEDHDMHRRSAQLARNRSRTVGESEEILPSRFEHEAATRPLGSYSAAYMLTHSERAQLRGFRAVVNMVAPVVAEEPVPAGFVPHVEEYRPLVDPVMCRAAEAQADFERDAERLAVFALTA